MEAVEGMFNIIYILWSKRINSGGSIWLEANKLSGSGNISANGGEGRNFEEFEFLCPM
jgi:hypothetical protein